MKDGGHRRIQKRAPHGNLALRFPAGSADRRHGISLSTVTPVPLAVLSLVPLVHKTTQLLRSPAFLDDEISPGAGVTAGCSRPLPADTAGKAGRTADGTTPQLDHVKFQSLGTVIWEQTEAEQKDCVPSTHAWRVRWPEGPLGEGPAFALHRRQGCASRFPLGASRGPRLAGSRVEAQAHAGLTSSRPLRGLPEPSPRLPPQMAEKSPNQQPTPRHTSETGYVLAKDIEGPFKMPN